MNNLWYVRTESKNRNSTKKDIIHPQLIIVIIRIQSRACRRRPRGGLAAAGGSAVATVARWIFQTLLLLAHLFRRQRVTRQTFQLERARQHVPTMLLHECIIRDEPSKSRRRAQPVQPFQTLSETSPRRVRVRGSVESVALPYLTFPSSRQVLVFLLGHVPIHVRG